MTTKQRRPITDLIKKAYLANFKVKLGDQDKKWASHKICGACVATSRKCSKRQKFGVPLVWHEPKNRHADGYFCMVNHEGFNSKTKHAASYPDIPSPGRPIDRCVKYTFPDFLACLVCSVKTPVVHKMKIIKLLTFYFIFFFPKALNVLCFLFSDVYEIVTRATEILHREKQPSRLLIVFRHLDHKKDDLTPEDYYQFFMKIALEAFQYEAETGSIVALDWAIELVEKMRDYLGDWQKQYVILVDIGFTIYNYIRDVSYRYATPVEEIQHSFRLCDRYRSVVNKTLLNNVNDVSDKKDLQFLTGAIYAAMVSSSSAMSRIDERRSLATELCNEVLKHRNDTSVHKCPFIIMGLYLYLAGKLHYQRDMFDEAWPNFIEAVEYLKPLGNTTRSTASYFYDAVFGED